MVKRIVWAGTALACWVATVGAAAAQDLPRPERRDNSRPIPGQQEQVPVRGTQGDKPAPAATSRQPQSHTSKAVIGSKVSIQGGLSIGIVEDIIFDDDGYVDYVLVLNDGKYVVVPWQAAKFNFEQRVATVNITQQQFQQAPTFTGQAWPTFDAAYQQRIYRYYGVTPRPVVLGR